MYTKAELQSPEMSKKGFYPSRTWVDAKAEWYIPSTLSDNRRNRKHTVTPDKPGKMYIMGNGGFVTRLQVIDGKRIIHWDRK